MAVNFPVHYLDHEDFVAAIKLGDVCLVVTDYLAWDTADAHSESKWTCHMLNSVPTLFGICSVITALNTGQNLLLLCALIPFLAKRLILRPGKYISTKKRNLWLGPLYLCTVAFWWLFGPWFSLTIVAIIWNEAVLRQKYDIGRFLIEEYCILSPDLFLALWYEGKVGIITRNQEEYWVDYKKTHEETVNDKDKFVRWRSLRSGISAAARLKNPVHESWT